MDVLLKVKNNEGLHARPAGMLAKKASEFQSTLQITVNGQTKSAKSIMGLMSLGLKKDQEFTLVAEGADAEIACAAISALVESEFK
jgi:phosphocarrier protein HPr